MLCGKVVTKHVKKIIVTNRPLVMTQPTRTGQIIGGEERASGVNYFRFACLGWFFLTGRNSCAVLASKELYVPFALFK